MWQKGGLHLAQLDEERAVEDLDLRRLGQVEHLSHDDLDDHVVDGDAVGDVEIEELGGAQLAVEIVGVEHRVDLLLDEEALDRVSARHDELLGHVRVVEHAEDGARQREYALLAVLGRHDGRELVDARRLGQSRLKGRVRTNDLRLTPIVRLQLLDLDPNAVEILKMANHGKFLEFLLKFERQKKNKRCSLLLVDAGRRSTRPSAKANSPFGVSYLVFFVVVV